MLVSFESRVGYHEVILKGAFSDKEAADVSARFETFLAGAPPEEASYACVLVNLRDATMISRRVFAVLVGYAALLRLRGKGTVLGWPTEAVRAFVDESRTQALLLPARDETEIFQSMVNSLHREYTPDFFAFLVNGQYLTKDQLRQLTAEHKGHAGKIPMERLLVDSKIFSWKTLLAAHVRYRLQKNPPPLRPEVGEPPRTDASGAARGLFGAPSVLPPGKPAPHPNAPPPDAFEAAAQAKAAIAEAAAPSPESEFVQPRLLGTILVELKILSQEQLRTALERQREEGRRAKLGDLLVRMGLVTDDQLFRALEHQFKRKRPAAPGGAGGRSEFIKKALLGEILLELGLLDERALKQALEAQRNSPSREKLGSVLLRLGLVTREQIFTALEAQADRKAARPGLEGVQR